MEQIQIGHKLEREELIVENCRIKEELTQTQAALHQEIEVNSWHLQSILILLLYVDDIIFTGSHSDLLGQFINRLSH
uniref:Uncharacterized protein n=1 Tax=Solanum lycopersicum TaxID=4081 RepID=A0A3Q7GV59_SOLLC